MTNEQHTQELETERDELAARLHAAEAELKKIREHRDQLQECLNNMCEWSSGLDQYSREAVEHLHKRLNCPEVRFLMGGGPSLQEVFRNVMAAGILDVQNLLGPTE